MPKKTIIAIAISLAALTVNGQDYIRASMKKDTGLNKIDIVFKPTYSSVAGEYVNYFQFSLAFPAAGNAGVKAKASGVNAFQDMGNIVVMGPFTEGAEMVYNFGFLNPSPPAHDNHYNWKNGEEFTGVVVTLSDIDPNMVKLVDFSNNENGSGGKNSNTLFGIVTNSGDKTDHLKSLFYEIPGQSKLGTYKTNGDQYVQIALR